MHIDQRKETINSSVVDPRLLTIIKAVEDPEFDIHATFEEGSEQALVALWEIRSRISLSANVQAVEPWTGIGKTGERFALVGRVSEKDLNFMSNTPGVKYIWLHESELAEYERLEALVQEQEAAAKARAERAVETDLEAWTYWLQTGRNYPSGGGGGSDDSGCRH